MHLKEANTSRGQTQRQPTKNSICTGGLDLGPTTCERESLWFGIRDQQTFVACESCPYISYIHGMGFSLQRVDLLTAKKGLSDLAVQLLQDGASRWWIAKMTSSPQGTFWLCLSENWDKMGQMLLLHHFPACDLRVALCSNLLHLKRALFLPNRRREIYGIPLQQSDKSSSGGFSNGLFFSGPVRCE